MREIQLDSEEGLLKRLQIGATIGTIVATICLPILIHLIPFEGSIPLGAILLPVFYAPLFAVYKYKYHVAIITSVIAPWLNHLITGFPAKPLLSVITIELFVFTLILIFLRNQKGIRWFAGPLVYIITKTISGSLIYLFPAILEGGIPLNYGINSISNATPGILVLLGINILVVKMNGNTGQNQSK
ncbi:MAG: hypothetical protein OEY34_03080 [Cyclobacteriaceae bacterium]|nr:hypothetical protein [Cyclobacteriaceae bacterium]